MIFGVFNTIRTKNCIVQRAPCLKTSPRDDKHCSVKIYHCDFLFRINSHPSRISALLKPSVPKAAASCRALLFNLHSHIHNQYSISSYIYMKAYIWVYIMVRVTKNIIVLRVNSLQYISTCALKMTHAQKHFSTLCYKIMYDIICVCLVLQISVDVDVA